MPSDPLPLSPETYEPATRHGKDIAKWFRKGDVIEEIDLDYLAGALYDVEQEARTLARAEVIAELKPILDEYGHEDFDTGRWYAKVAGDYILEALAAVLSRLGERE